MLQAAIASHPRVIAAVAKTWAVPTFAVGTFKFLYNKAGTPPQFLHADHLQTDGMFGIVQLTATSRARR